jgi:glycosyltransferase involved in cell wall biosynthesis
LLGRLIDYLCFHFGAFWYLIVNLRRGDICVVCSDPPMITATTILPVIIRGAVQVNWLFDLFPEVAIGLNVVKRGSLVGAFNLWLRDRALRFSRLNVTPMRAMSEYLETRGVPRSLLVIVESWSDGDSIRPMPTRDCSLRSEWGLSDKFVVGYSGNLGRAHEFATILDAAETLRDRDDIAFVFVGGGFRRPWVESEVARRGLSNVVMKPLQPRERLREVLAVPDVHLVSLLPEMEPFVVPSKFYGIAAAGRPTIFVGAKDGEIARLVDGNACGESVSIGDSGCLAQTISRMADWEPLCPAMGSNARRLFEALYTDTRGIAAWIEIFRQLGVPERRNTGKIAMRKLAS